MGDQAKADTDATERVLAAMLAETLALMEEVAAMGDRRAASGRASPHEISLVLRMGSRLARIGGWLVARENGAPAERIEAGAGLEGARHCGLDRGADIGPMAEIAARVDRLAERALRMSGLLNELPERRCAGETLVERDAGPTPEAFGAAPGSGCGATVLPFRFSTSPRE